MGEQKLGEPFALDGFHDDVKVGFIEEVLLDLYDVGVIQVLQVLDFLHRVDLVLFLYGNDLTYALNFADPVDHFPDKTCRATVDDFRKMVKLKHLPDIVTHKLSVADFEFLWIFL